MITSPFPRTANAALLDAAEKYVMAAVFAFFAYRMVDAYMATGAIVTLLYLGDQLTVLVFILLRRPPVEISLRVNDWIVGFAGTLLAILLGPPGPDALLPPLAVTCLMLLGFLVHFSAKLVLARSFGVVAANRGVKVSGPYLLVRHPMYLGYIISQSALWLAGPTIANSIIIICCWMLFVIRIEAEERLLRRDPAYTDLAARTRFRLIPGVY